MSNAVITGATETVGSALRAYLAALDVDVVGWDRGAVPLDERVRIPELSERLAELLALVGT